MLLKKESPLRITPSPSAKVIYLKERSFHMLKKDLILRNPLRLLGKDSDYILPKGGFGAVLARAGVGKTSLMVQMALDTLLNGKNVLHISLTDPVRKVDLWYEEVFRNIAEHYRLKKTDELWDSILPHRFIMTFQVERFSVPTLEERLTDLTEQGIFFPDVLIIDGLPFDNSTQKALSDLKRLAADYAMRVWFAVRTHRHDPIGTDNIPQTLSGFSGMFDVILHIQPEGKEIHVKVHKGTSLDSDPPVLFLDPSTMLIKDKE